MTVVSDTALCTLPIRLHPGDDLRRSLDMLIARHGSTAAFVLDGIGSLRTASVRLAGMSEPTLFEGDTEVLTLSESIAANGSHLHIAVADAQGRVTGGHVGHGCIVRTTAEILVALLPAWQFLRERDATTGWDELAIGPAASAR
ncbi:MAG: PPC domain-containing DNA-binding protein [Janthinobacterium lividum]